MTQPIERDAIYRRRRFPREVIEGCVRWYPTYRLSYRDLVALMAEWGVHVSHTTVMRWVHRYVPEYEKRWNRRAKPVGSSWRMDETYIQTRPKTGYLYRAVDKQGKAVESLFQTQRGIAAAMAFFRKAVVTCAPRWPRKILAWNKELARRLDELEAHIEKKLTAYDRAIAAIFLAIRQLTNPLTPKQRPIGFTGNLR